MFSHSVRWLVSMRILWMFEGTGKHHTSILFTRVHYTNTLISWLLDYTDIEGTRFSSEISHTRTDLIAQLNWQSIGLVFQRSQVRIPPWPGIFFKPVRCGYTLRVTSHKHLIHLSTLHQHINIMIIRLHWGPLYTSPGWFSTRFSRPQVVIFLFCLH